MKPLFILVVALLLSPWTITTARESTGGISEVSDSWKKAYKFDKKIQSDVNSSLELMIHADEFLNHPEVDADLRARVEKVRDEAFARIGNLEERVLPYLLFE